MFTIVGGNPFTGYTGTTTFTSLYVVGNAETYEEMERIVAEKFEECCGLMLVLYNGKELRYDINGKFIIPE